MHAVRKDRCAKPLNRCQKDCCGSSRISAQKPQLSYNAGNRSAYSHALTSAGNIWGCRFRNRVSARRQASALNALRGPTATATATATIMSLSAASQKAVWWFSAFPGVLHFLNGPLPSQGPKAMQSHQHVNTPPVRLRGAASARPTCRIGGAGVRRSVGTGQFRDLRRHRLRQGGHSVSLRRA